MAMFIAKVTHSYEEHLIDENHWYVKHLMKFTKPALEVAYHLAFEIANSQQRLDDYIKNTENKLEEK